MSIRINRLPRIMHLIAATVFIVLLNLVGVGLQPLEAAPLAQDQDRAGCDTILNAGEILTAEQELHNIINSVSVATEFCLEAGIYTLSNTIYPPAGTENKRTVIRSVGGGVTINWEPTQSADDPSQNVNPASNMIYILPDTNRGRAPEGEYYVEIRGLRLNANGMSEFPIKCDDSYHIWVLDNVLENGQTGGFGSIKCDYMTIDGNLIHKSGTGRGWSSGVSFKENVWSDRAEEVGFHNYVVNNIISGMTDESQINGKWYHTDGNGIIVDLTEGEVTSNLDHKDPTRDDFEHPADTPPTLIANNVVYHNGGRCIQILLVSNVWVVNNTCYQNALDCRLGFRAIWRAEEEWKRQYPDRDPIEDRTIINQGYVDNPPMDCNASNDLGHLLNGERVIGERVIPVGDLVTAHSKDSYFINNIASSYSSSANNYRSPFEYSVRYVDHDGDELDDDENNTPREPRDFNENIQYRTNRYKGTLRPVDGGLPASWEDGGDQEQPEEITATLFVNPPDLPVYPPVKPWLRAIHPKDIGDAFHLQTSGSTSPAINTGSDPVALAQDELQDEPDRDSERGRLLQAIISDLENDNSYTKKDIRGFSRPPGAYDLGAYEMGSPGADPTPTPAPPTDCGPLVQEAEDGARFGNFTNSSDTNASGGEFIHVPNDPNVQYNQGPPPNNNHYSEYCFTVTTAGSYYIKGRVGADSPIPAWDDKSFYVTVEGVTNNHLTWIIDPRIPNYHMSYVTSSNDFQSAPAIVQLGSGNHTIRVYQYEDGTRLDTLELELVSATPPTPTPSGCGPLSQEAENAEYEGYFRIGEDNGASGGEYLYVPFEGRFDSDSRISFCFSMTDAGDYKLKGGVYAEDGEHDSFFVTVNGQPSGGYVWYTSHSTSYEQDYVNDRDNNDVVVRLEPGDHTVIVSAREDGTRLDTLTLERVGGTTPTPVPPTPTPVPPTPVPTSTPTLTPTPTATPVLPTPTSVSTPTPAPVEGVDVLFDKNNYEPDDPWQYAIQNGHNTEKSTENDGSVKVILDNHGSNGYGDTIYLENWNSSEISTDTHSHVRFKIRYEVPGPGNHLNFKIQGSNNSKTLKPGEADNAEVGTECTTCTYTIALTAFFGENQSVDIKRLIWGKTTSAQVTFYIEKVEFVQSSADVDILFDGNDSYYANDWGFGNELSHETQISSDDGSVMVILNQHLSDGNQNNDTVYLQNWSSSGISTNSHSHVRLKIRYDVSGRRDHLNFKIQDSNSSKTLDPEDTVDEEVDIECTNTTCTYTIALTAFFGENQSVNIKRLIWGKSTSAQVTFYIEKVEFIKSTASLGAARLNTQLELDEKLYIPFVTQR